MHTASMIVAQIVCSGPFRINELILGCLKYTILSKDLLEGVSSVAF